MSEGDYLLGTRDDEIARLGLQHRVWRGEMLAGFRHRRPCRHRRAIRQGQWPASFIATNAWRLHELGYCTAAEAEGFATMLDRAEPGTRMLTPVVAEVIAVKL